MSKTLFLNVEAQLNAHGITSDTIPAKLEGLAFGQDVVINSTTKHTLYVANDNDFTATVGGLDNPNQFFVFAFDNADLPPQSSGFVRQQINTHSSFCSAEHSEELDGE